MKFNIREFRLSRKMLLILGVVATIFLVGVYFSRFRSTSAQANVTLQKKTLFNQKRFRLSYVKRRSLERWAVIPGIVHAFRKAKIYAHVPGYLKFLNVDKGDFVRRGQVLAYIYDPELYQSYQKSLAEAEIAKITFERKKKSGKEIIGLSRWKMFKRQKLFFGKRKQKPNMIMNSSAIRRSWPPSMELLHIGILIHGT